MKFENFQIGSKLIESCFKIDLKLMETPNEIIKKWTIWGEFKNFINFLSIFWLSKEIKNELFPLKLKANVKNRNGTRTLEHQSTDIPIPKVQKGKSEKRKFIK